MCGVCSVFTVHCRVAMMIRNRREGSVETGDETDLMPEPRVVNHGEGAARWLSFETSSSEEELGTRDAGTRVLWGLEHPQLKNCGG